MLVDIIAGARPNFIKIAPIIHAVQKAQINGKSIDFRLIHTGQHFDKVMSQIFFDQLDIPSPNFNLNAGGGTQSEQTATIMVNYEKLLILKKPTLTLVVGDVTSTMACAITAQKMNIKVAHVEAGIRSGDWTMPEEINRLVTDSITNYYFTTSEFANENLRLSGISDDCIFYVGNTMIDTLLKNKYRFVKPSIWNEANLQVKKYIVLTLHRPSNVDDASNLNYLLKEIIENANGIPIVFPVHPRTSKILDNISFDKNNIHVIEPLSYLEFNYLVENASAVITDSGGITEETTVMGVPCMTLRNSTERPETVSMGTNELIGTDPKAIAPAMAKLFHSEWKKGRPIPLWDGNAAERIVNQILKIYHL